MWNWSKRSAEHSHNSPNSKPRVKPKDKELLRDKLGDALAERVVHYLESQSCTLRISRPRKTKYGDFRVRDRQVVISVNEDLNPFRFALTLFHEMAHLLTYRTHGFRVEPHGKQWKNAYRHLLVEFDVKRLFVVNEQLMKVYAAEWESPSAQAGLFGIKEQVLSGYDRPDGRIALSEVSENQRFEFRGRYYIKLRDQRSRALCIRMDNQRKYTLSLAARVDSLSENQ